MVLVSFPDCLRSTGSEIFGWKWGKASFYIKDDVVGELIQSCEAGAVDEIFFLDPPAARLASVILASGRLGAVEVPSAEPGISSDGVRSLGRFHT
jgi:hypothetical protein